MPEFSTLQYEIVDHVLTLTMNRPERLNAFNSEMQREFLEALDHADADDDIRVVIVTGAGRGFCAGADLSRGAETFDYDNQDSEAKEERASNEGRRQGE
ncbi:MAG: enoyl-CoA hydratase-related protein, partial [Actinomycetota bacterium]|nr:enoyl-CoA hydratase-related protein [Actinomycetota bacterium]